MAKNTMAVTFDSKGIQAGLDRLGSQAVKASHEAARQGGEHMYFSARVTCPVNAEDTVFYGHGGQYHFPAGNLRNSIYMVYSKDKSSATRTTYHISWNRDKAPYGYMVEFGTARAEANPWLRRAYDQSHVEALTLANVRFKAEMAGVTS